MSGAGPSRRPRGSIKRSVLVRLDAEQAQAVGILETATGQSAAAILLTAWAERTGKLPPLPQPPKVLPAAADAAVLLTIRQIGGLLGKGVREKTLPTDQAEKALADLRRCAVAYEERIRAAG